MRFLTIIVVLVAALWGGFWAIGSRFLDSAARDFLGGQPGVRYSGLSVGGFPNRFDLTVDGLHVEAPDGSVTWDAPFAQVFAMTWKPWHVIAALPAEQTVTLPDQVVTVASSYFQGSLVVTPDTSAALDRVSVIGRDLALTSTAEWAGGAKEISFATRRDAVDDKAHQIGLRVTDLAPDPALMARLTGPSGLPPVIALFRADATVTLTAPLDRFAGDNPPKVTAIDIRDVTLTWGDLRLSGKGRITAGPDGLAQGRIDWQLANWRLVPGLVVGAGLVQPAVGPTVTRGLEVLAQQSPDPEILALTLVMENGRMTLGPFPLGPAPRLN